MIDFEMRDGIAKLTMNRPESLNAFVQTMSEEMVDALKKAARDEGVRVVVITGAGRAFSSGEDLGNLSQGEPADYGDILRKRYIPVIQAITSLEKPVIAAVNGVAAGAGCSLALACDFRIASDKASFIEAFVHIGLIPDAGSTYFLPRLVGYAKAMEIACFGEKISGIDAAALGLVTKTVPAEEFETVVEQFAARFAQMPTKAVGLIKRTLLRNMDVPLSDALGYEAYGQRIAGQTEDHAEGIRAFFEKRKPVFQGR
jgi:2-(1,2-epoxy-1,2-dihydrophenyl)acetyl-CoA isomerase